MHIFLLQLTTFSTQNDDLFLFGSMIWELSAFDCFHFYFLNTKIKPLKPDTDSIQLEKSFHRGHLSLCDSFFASFSGRYHFGNNWCQKKRFKDQMTAEFILASNLIMLVFIPLGIFHYTTGQLLLKEISSKVNFMSLLDINSLHNKSTIILASKSLSDPNCNFLQTNSIYRH